MWQNLCLLHRPSREKILFQTLFCGKIYTLPYFRNVKFQNQCRYEMIKSYFTLEFYFQVHHQFIFQRDPEWQLFQFECEFCPYFQDMRKYRRKAELVRHQALHFPDQARKFKCTMCAYSATR